MTDGERIKLIRKDLGLTQEAFGEPLGISKGHISDVEKGKKNLSTSAIELLKVRFAINEHWWQTGEGPVFQAKKCPDFGKVAEQLEISTRLEEAAYTPKIPVLKRITANFPDIHVDDVTHYLYLPKAPSNSFAMTASDHSMEPCIYYGDYVLFMPNGSYEHRDVLVVLDEWGDATVRRLKEKEGSRYLVPDNPAFPVVPWHDQYKVVGKVLRVWREVRF